VPEHDVEAVAEARPRLARRAAQRRAGSGGPPPSSPGPAPAIGAPHPLLQLQRQHGNRHVQRVVARARKAEGGAEVDRAVEDAIQRARGSGQPLDSGVRAQMERTLGADFGGVRVHTGAEADTLSRAVSARAFTTGRDVFFRQGAYAPGSSGGRELLAHELTHVVQQAGPGIQRKLAISRPGDPHEQEADRVAQAAIRQEQWSAPPIAAEPAIARQADEEDQEPIQMKADPALQRQPEEPEEAEDAGPP
jgi:hypothetical protein